MLPIAGGVSGLNSGLRRTLRAIGQREKLELIFISRIRILYRTMPRMIAMAATLQIPQRVSFLSLEGDSFLLKNKALRQ